MPAATSVRSSSSCAPSSSGSWRRGAPGGLDGGLGVADAQQAPARPGGVPRPPGPRTGRGPASATGRTPGSRAVLPRPAVSRRSRRRAACRPTGPARPATGRRHRSGSGRRETTPDPGRSGAGRPGTSAAHPAGRRPRGTVPPPVRPGSRAGRPGPPGPAGPTTSVRAAAGPDSRPHPRCAGARAAVPSVSPAARLSRVAATGCPCSACTSAVVRPFPAIPQSPLRTSSTRTQVTGRRFSPSISTIVSVILVIISCFCWEVNTPSITFTVTIGIVMLPSSSIP